MKKKILSLLTAFAMVFGIIAAPFTSASAAEVTVTPPTGTLTEEQLSETKPETTEVNLYKLTTKEDYAKGAPWKHTGGKIDPSEDDTKAYPTLGKDVKALKGAQFTFYKINGTDDVENEKILELLKANSSKFETVEQMNNLIAKGAQNLSASEADTNLKAIEANKLALATGKGLTDGHTEDTTEEGLATVNLAEGYYWVIESKIPDKITGQIAVPFGLTLPLTNSTDVGQIKKGTRYLKKLYIYPKNIETDKVKIDKNHAKYDKENKKWVDQNGKEVADADLGADYAKYQADKKTVSAELGKKVPYESKTEIPRNYKFETFSWQDVMSEGLTYNKDLKVTIDYTKKNDQGEDEAVTGEVFIDTKSDPKVNANYVTREKDNGFDIKVTKDQVQETLVKYLKNGPVTFHFSYSATVNKDTVVDKPLTNSITYTPGEPNGGGKVTTGDDKSIKVTKTWNTTEQPTVNEITYYVEDADGKGVASVTLKNTNQAGDKIVAGPGIEFTVGDNWYSGTFTGLEAGKEYTVREAVVGYDPTYTPGQNGALGIDNKTNPDTLKPTEPKVENHGRKFVKYDQLDGTKRLAGAEFVVKNNNDTYPDFKGKYLVAKTSTQADADKVNLETAKSELDAKVEAYNKLSAEDQKGEKGTKAKADIDTAQKAYNKAFKEAANAYTWGEKADAVVFVSDSKGGFEVTGLYAGAYQLEEIKAPEGYALNDKAIDFEVKHGTYKSAEGETELDYTSSEETGDYGLKIANKKVTIPQTGGIGSLIFIVAGLAIMGGAFVAYRKSQSVEA